MITKRSLIPLLCLSFAYLAHGQGTVLFLNHTSAVSAQVFDVGGTTPVSGPDIVAALFLGDVQEGAAAPFRTGAGAGYWNPGPDPIRVIAGVPGGGTATLTVKAWDSTKGATYAAAVAAGGKYGSSDGFTITLGGGGTPPSVPADMIGFRLSFIPEPEISLILAAGLTGLFWKSPRRKPSAHNPGVEEHL